MKKILPAFVVLLLFSCSVDQPVKEEVSTEADAKVQEHRIVSLNGTTTEILIELGMQNELVGVDVTSANLSSAQNLGHTSKIAVEPIVNLNPTLVVYKSNELGAQLIEKLLNLGIELLEVNPDFTVASLNEMIEVLAIAVNKEDEAAKLKLEDDFAASFKLENTPKVVFIYARGPGAMQMAGSGTAETKIIELAGGANPFDFDQYRPVTAEALVAANPDFVLMYESGFKSLEQAHGLKAIPGIMETTAGKNNALITMDANLLHNFSVSLPKAVEELHQAIK